MYMHVAIVVHKCTCYVSALQVAGSRCMSLSGGWLIVGLYIRYEGALEVVCLGPRQWEQMFVCGSTNV